LYDAVVITGTRLPCVVAIMVAVILSYLAYRPRPKPPKWGAWPAIFAVLALYGFLAALAPAGWNEPLVLLGIGFAALSGYAWLDPARRMPARRMPSTRIPSTSVSSTSEAQASRGRKWFG